MAIPELVEKTARKLLERYCAERVFVRGGEQERLTFELWDEGFTLFRETAAGGADGLSSPVARFRYCRELGQWTLHYPDAQQRWRFYLNAGPTLNLARLLSHLDADPLNHFWA